MGIKESTCCDEHWVTQGSAESLDCMPETNITLYINHTRLGQLKNKRSYFVPHGMGFQSSLSILHTTKSYLKSFISFLSAPSLSLLSLMSLPDVQTSGIVCWKQDLHMISGGLSGLPLVYICACHLCYHYSYQRGMCGVHPPIFINLKGTAFSLKRSITVVAGQLW